METAKVFEYEENKAIKLPADYRLQEDEMVIRRLGDVILLVPKSKVWETFMEGINGFTDDFMADDRSPDYPSTREKL